MNTKSTFEGRVALVTGASGGIGGQTALALAADGANVALAHGTHIEDAEAVAAGIRELGRDAILLSGDLADPEVPAGSSQIPPRSSDPATSWSPTPASGRSWPGTKWTSRRGIARSTSTCAPRGC